MTIEKEQVGVNVHLDASECELFIRLASDLEKLDGEQSASRAGAAQNYFSISAELAKRIRALQTR